MLNKWVIHLLRFFWMNFTMEKEGNVMASWGFYRNDSDYLKDRYLQSSVNQVPHQIQLSWVNLEIYQKYLHCIVVRTCSTCRQQSDGYNLLIQLLTYEFWQGLRTLVFNVTESCALTAVIVWLRSSFPCSTLYSSSWSVLFFLLVAVGYAALSLQSIVSFQ